MLFNSFEFIFVFLPVTLIIFQVASRLRLPWIVLFWLVVASLFFYGWWRPAYLYLLGSSIGFNYLMGLLIGRQPDRPRSSHFLVGIGVAGNLALLGYYKYADFFVTNLSEVFGASWRFEEVILPLAISFFTFQQIAYLVDVWRGQESERDFLRYSLFVSFFPQLIAGPIVHHREMLPQYVREYLKGISAQNLAIGGTIFILGLGKKVLLADSLAGYADPVFAAATLGESLTLLEAWSGALAFTFQIYFDFSGYSDMAIGLAAMFGIRLPLNFDSPYKARDIIDFWRRWHMTLSRFLRNYLYIRHSPYQTGGVQRTHNPLR